MGGLRLLQLEAGALRCVSRSRWRCKSDKKMTNSFTKSMHNRVGNAAPAKGWEWIMGGLMILYEQYRGDGKEGPPRDICKL